MIAEASVYAERAMRQDLVDRLTAARERITRPDTVIAVVGEFKQGKSSLVNSLLGEELCPVDDDLATATLTLIRDGPPEATAWRHADGEYVAETVAVDAIGELVTEMDEPGGRGRIALVDVRLPNSFLSSGIALADSPGVGGLAPGHLGLTLAYLRNADALLFVSDASSPLTGTEVAFLREAMEACPVALVVLSKVDLFPDWRRVLDINRAALESERITAGIVAVSSELRAEAFRRGDRSLNDESGLPALLQVVASDVLEPARERAATRSLSDLSFVVRQVETALAMEQTTLESPGETENALEMLEAERQRLDRLRAAGSRWQLLMQDRFSDLIADAEHVFRQAVRQAGRDADETLEATDPAKTWEEVAATIRDRMAEAVSKLIRDLEGGTDDIAAAIVELLREDDLHLDPALGRAEPTDVARLWTGTGKLASGFGEAAATGWATLRGAQGGILVFGMLGGLAGLALSTTMLLGVGAVFGGKGLFDERKKQVTQRRQKARSAVRQFLDDVQFETGKSMRDLSRDLQRQLRDHFSERIAETTRTCAAAAESLQANVRQGTAERTARLGIVRKEIEGVRALGMRIEAASRPAE